MFLNPDRFYCNLYKNMGKTKDKIIRFLVKEPSELMAFLLCEMKESSRTTVKRLLTQGQVSVNDKYLTQYNHPLKEGDTVSINYSERHVNFRHTRIRILFEDEDVIVINKREGLLAVTMGKENEVTAFGILLEYLKKKNPRNTLFVVHRLDRETSGVMMFAKNREFQMKIQHRWHENIIERKYIALVEGVVEQKEGRMVSYLTENPKSLKMHSNRHNNKGQEAITKYKVLSVSKSYSMLEIDLETGRKNQIRVHMQEMGHSVVGDKKYGGTTSPIGRMGLHARILSYRHPATGKIFRFEAPVPEKFSI